MTTQTKQNQIQFSGLDIINDVLNADTSKLVSAFKAMKTYSIYNTMYACLQMDMRKLPITPIKTFNQVSVSGSLFIFCGKGIPLRARGFLQQILGEKRCYGNGL